MPRVEWRIRNLFVYPGAVRGKSQVAAAAAAAASTAAVDGSHRGPVCSAVCFLPNYRGDWNN